MSTVAKLIPVSIEDYLAGELISPVKHEFVNGCVYAMAGARNVHNIISMNIAGSLHARLRGHPCRPFNSDTKIRIRIGTQVRFYYPDVSVVCRPNSQQDSFHDEPAVLFEVLSRQTRRIDEGEKQEAYLTIPSLNVYVMINQEAAELVAVRRTIDGFISEVYRGLDAILPLSEIGIELPLAEIYETVEFTADAEDIAAV